MKKREQNSGDNYGGYCSCGLRENRQQTSAEERFLKQRSENETEDQQLDDRNGRYDLVAKPEVKCNSGGKRCSHNKTGDDVGYLRHYPP